MESLEHKPSDSERREGADDERERLEVAMAGRGEQRATTGGVR
jgi:hypothetical protein